MDRARALMTAGAVLIVLGLLTGLAVAAMPFPRLALSSHLEAMMNGLVLMVLGLAWGHLRLSPRLSAVAFWAALYGAFANWVGTGLSGFWGGSRFLPIASGGQTAAPGPALLIDALLVTLAVADILALALVAFGLGRRR